MRVSPKRRRRWNNILILGIIAFIGLLNLPTLIKTYLIDEPVVESQYPYLLNPNAELQALHFSSWSLEKNQGRWRSTIPTSISEQELAERWQGLVGTEVTQANFDSLKPQLTSPQSIEAWYIDQEEPQRITYYQTPQFWLLKNWQDKWIAISVESAYLVPSEF
ncbi:hypothetical protein L1D54_08260 [Vibrio brasiliensis]|uniref:50S ribosomal protein L33 n=1 Tax=Vibrio brasiliensis LMG 20546 TaxID=945543 RepID=E8M023_9VIBR|nr:hypothetical protein [Vibrio brasiliensis]EGA63675.1 hypothetical protein VIBR0546_16306 [Vibrio brasiliensis LMG 20546]MCG9723753.1 hypothetical protein [Vibrio brasiliensis]MCG9750471.1 hypothetical protein [Vibrio brasiliensis]